ncbi:Hypothetical protein NTJ_15732 [Nesidiocoris tenuis]|uniref:Transposase Tc1-like domain-containing protein n=1 Tax=Nesidiocoris tenuis TaxID=355587 RepID=A0ABN7BEW7_9HEMI|nr:Hypothetical protein NTJ_15732 [Nesidiocoris tenuis]
MARAISPPTRIVVPRMEILNLMNQIVIRFGISRSTVNLGRTSLDKNVAKTYNKKRHHSRGTFHRHWPIHVKSFTAIDIRKGRRSQVRSGEIKNGNITMP